MRRTGWIGISVLLCAVIVAIPILPGFAAGAPSSSSGASGGLASTSPVPAALRLAWSERTGFDAGRLSEMTQVVPANEANLSVLLTLWPRDPSYFSPQVGASPMTAAQVRANFAPAPDQYLAILDYFAGHGLTVVHAWPDGLSLTLAGSASAVGTAFGTELVDGNWNGREVRLPETTPSLPASIEPLISSISGLSNGFGAFTVPFTSAALSGSHPARTSTLLWPSAAHGIYGLDGLYNYSGSPHWATGIGIALVLWGEGYAPSDIGSFFSSYYPSEFPAIHYAAYPIDGALSPSANSVNDPSNVTSEMTLDMEWAGSMAPGSTVSAVYAPDGPAKNGYSPSDVALEDALNYAINDVPLVKVVSMSFGTPDGADTTFEAAFTQLLAGAQNRGITALAASGDTGGTARLNCLGGPVPEFPAASEYVVAVGGTAPVLALDAFGGVTGLSSEPAWNRSGGGYSTTVPAPSWQKVGSAAGPITAQGRRGLPDVAGPAYDNVFFYNGQEAAGAGTSFAAPMWGGMIAEMDAIRGRPLGFVTPRFYAVGAGEANRTSAIGLVDITEGSNCLGPATSGWDTSTGWGSPRGLTLYQDLSGTFVNVTITVSTGTVAPGQTFDASVHVANVTSLAPIRGASVAFSLDSINYVGPCGGSVGSGAASTSASGDASASLTVPGCYLGLDIQITATVSGGPYFGSNVTIVHVNLVGLAGFLAVVQIYPYNYAAFAGIILLAVLIGWRVGDWRERRYRRNHPAPKPPGPAGPQATPAAPPSTPPEGVAATAPGVPRTASPVVGISVPPPVTRTPTFSDSPPTSISEPGGSEPRESGNPATLAVASPPSTAPDSTTLSAPLETASPPILVRRRSPVRQPTSRPSGRNPAPTSPAASARPPGPGPARGAPRPPRAAPRPPVAAAAPTEATAAPAAVRDVCPVCRAPVAAGAATCAVCGAPLV